MSGIFSAKRINIKDYVVKKEEIKFDKKKYLLPFIWDATDEQGAAQADEQAGDGAGHRQHDEVIPQLGGIHQPHGHQDLSHVVGDAAGHADPRLGQEIQPLEQGHHRHAQDTAGQTVQKSHPVAE